MIRRVTPSALALCITQAFCLAVFAAEGVPRLLNYQGKLADSLGKPVDGSMQMTFEFYDAAAAANLLEGFSETQEVVVTKGIFSVLIGSATAGGVPPAVLDHASVYLSIKVDGEQLSPRQPITSVAYAFRSAQSDNAGALEGRASTDFALKSDLPDALGIQTALAGLQARVSALEAGVGWTLVIEPPQGSGSTIPLPRSYGYATGSASAAVTAIAYPGWEFDHREGTAVSGAPGTNPISIASGPAGQTETLKAVFVEVVGLAPMCSVPAGDFQTSTGTTVHLDAYLIDKYETTNGLYAMFLNAGGNDDHYHNEMSPEIHQNVTAAPYTYQVISGFERRPVRWVTYADATDFCTWRSTAEGLPVGSCRLPTEAEWEKAAGWGDPARTALWTYAFQSDSINCGKANYVDCALGTTRDVGYYTAWRSYYGCYDMTGNVWEWCYDWYGSSTYPSSTSNPTGPTTGSGRVTRGGGFGGSAMWCRVDYRGGHAPRVGIYTSGFRSARTAP